MSLDLSTIITVVMGVVAFVASMLVRSARGERDIAVKERDDANAEAMSANQRVESLKNIEEIKRERQEKDNTITVDRERPLGVWHDDKDSDR